MIILRKNRHGENSENQVEVTLLYGTFMGFPDGSDGKECTCNQGDLGLTPGLGRSPREGNGYPLQYSCLENPMGREAWWATIHGVTKSQT